MIFRDHLQVDGLAECSISFNIAYFLLELLWSNFVYLIYGNGFDSENKPW